MAGFKPEVGFGLDNFQKPKVLSLKDSIAQIISNLFFMRPGNLPSLPHIGINIREYLYQLDGDLDVEGLKEKIYSQCAELISVISIGEIKIFIAPYNGMDILMIIIPIIGLGEEQNLVLAFAENNNELLFNYQFTNETLFN